MQRNVCKYVLKHEDACRIACAHIHLSICAHAKKRMHICLQAITNEECQKKSDLRPNRLVQSTALLPRSPLLRLPRSPLLCLPRSPLLRLPACVCGACVVCVCVVRARARVCVCVIIIMKTFIFQISKNNVCERKKKCFHKICIH